MQTPPSVDSPVSDDMSGSSFPGMENLPFFWQRMDGRRTVCASVDSELSSSQNNLYAKVAYSDSLQ